MPISRRVLLAGTAAALLPRPSAGLTALAASPSTRSTSRLKLRTFSYGDVKLTGGPLQGQFDHALDFFLKLDEDRILKVYRAQAGLPAPGQDMGGWYDATGFGPGHGLGQWMSALARFAAAGSADAREKVGRLVEGFSATIGRGKPFYEYRFPVYIYDKHVIGLTDAYRYAGIDAARDVLKRATDAAMPFLPEKALTREEMLARPHKDHTYTLDESYTIAENQFIAYQVFGDDRYLELGKRFLHDEPYFNKLAAGEPAMVGKHAYSHVNALGSAAMAYGVLGTEKHLAAIRNAWDMIDRDQRFATGGWGPTENFVEPNKGLRYESLFTTRNHFETPCGSYATMKLARYLAQFTGESRYGDGLERVLYNGILAAKPIQPDGHTFYYSDYQDDARKIYHPDKWPCCSGTYPQAIVDYLISAYFHDDENVYVNLYAPSELRWKRERGDVKLTQTTDYPENGRVSIRVDVQGDPNFAVHLRLPQWVGNASGVSLMVNGVRNSVIPAGGNFLRLAKPVEGRAWKSGDTIVLDLPLPFRQEPIDAQHPQTVAMMRGPVLHVGIAERPVLSRAAPDAAPVARNGFRFMPFYKVNNEAYTTYFTME